MTGWKNLPSRIFVSHSYDDTEQVERLRQRLTEQAAHVEPVIWELEDPDPQCGSSQLWI